MLKDGYAEYIIKAKTPGGTIVLMVIGILLTVLGMFGILTSNFGILFVVIGIVLICFSVSIRDVEYEYIMVNDDIEISRITAKKSRKVIYNFCNNDVKYIVKSDSIYLDNEKRANGNTSIKVRDFTCSENEDDEDVYVFVVNSKDKMEFVYMELKDNTLEHVNIFFKGKFKE